MVTVSTKSLPHPAALWDAYHADRSDAARNALVTYYAPMLRGFVDGFASRLPPDADVDDIASAAGLALIQAVERYDPAQKVQFWSFASHRINGAMLDSCRNSDRIPRLVREAHKKLSRARDTLMATLGREPTRDEIRAELNVSPKQFALIEQRAARMVEWRSTAAVIGANDHDKTQSLGEVLTDHRHEEPTLRIERADMIAHVLNCLPPRYGMFISFYYLQGETMKRIGQRLDMSESRVSQLVTQSLRFARSVFAEAA